MFGVMWNSLVFCDRRVEDLLEAVPNINYIPEDLEGGPLHAALDIPDKNKCAEMVKRLLCCGIDTNLRFAGRFLFLIHLYI